MLFVAAEIAAETKLYYYNYLLYKMLKTRQVRQGKKFTHKVAGDDGHIRNAV